jgi:nicotinamidase-related amidase
VGAQTALLLVDVLKDFEHEDGNRLLASFRARHARLVELLTATREQEHPVVYANDTGESGDAEELLRLALAGRGAELVDLVAPLPGEPVVLKERYSAFDGTKLASDLEDLGVTELTIAGAATEMCVFQSVIDGLRQGLGFTVAADACATVDEEHEALALDYLERVLGVPVTGRR